MSDWMSMDEVIDHVMRVEGCSRRAARRLIAKHMKAGDLPYQLETTTQTKFLDGKTAAKMVKDEPDHVLISLNELMKAYRYTADELLTELRNGRLVASAINESVAIAMELQRRGDDSIPLHASDFVVSASNLIGWIENPETPPDIVAKYFRRMQ